MQDDTTNTAFEIRYDRRDVIFQGQAVSVGARAFDVLAYLATHSGRVVTKAELLDHVWNGTHVEEGNLTVQVSSLRRQFGAKAICTVPGVGYQFTLVPDQPVQDVPAIDTTPHPALPDKPSLAVLPFTNLTGDAGKDYLVDGIVSDLISALSRIPVIFVIASTSSFLYKGRAVDMAEVGRELGVRYVLEGSIQEAGGQYRITTQLVEAETGHTIWTDRFVGAVEDIFALQDQITERVAAEIEPSLIEAEAKRARSKPTKDLRAYDLNLQAVPLLLRVASLEDFHKGLALLDRALELDPDYSEAKALKCRAYMIAFASRWITHEEARVIVPLAEEVMKTHRNDPLSIASAAHALAYLDGQQRMGVAALKRAVALNPNSVIILGSSGWVHAYVGEVETSVEHFRRAIRINPLNPNIGFVHSGLGQALMTNGDLDTAIYHLELAHAETPEFYTTVLALAVAYWALDRKDEAAQMTALLLEKVPDMTVSSYLQRTPFIVAEYQALMRDALLATGVPR